MQRWCPPCSCPTVRRLYVYGTHLYAVSAEIVWVGEVEHDGRIVDHLRQNLTASTDAGKLSLFDPKSSPAFIRAAVDRRRQGYRSAPRQPFPLPVQPDAAPFPLTAAARRATAARTVIFSSALMRDCTIAARFALHLQHPPASAARSEYSEYALPLSGVLLPPAADRPKCAANVSAKRKALWTLPKVPQSDCGNRCAALPTITHRALPCTLRSTLSKA